jgi:predicted permease
MSSIRYLLRTLRKSPGFSLSVIATLAIGIAANVAVFTVTNALLLKPLPFRDPHRLVLLDATHKDDGSSNGFTLNRYELFRDDTRTLSGLAVAATESMNLSGEGVPQQISVGRVSGNFFNLLGLQPELGRTFDDQDTKREARPVVIISHELWQTRFGGDANVVGRTLNLDGVPETIVGVLPQGMQFSFLSPAEVWLPRYYELTLFSTERLRRGVGYLTAIGRLAPGSSIEAARSEMELLQHRYSEANPAAPDQGAGFQIRVGDLQELSVEDLRLRLRLLSAAVGLVLLIAIANAAGLFLSRAVSRRHDTAVRVALGATRLVIVRQLLAECLTLALSAGLLGLILASAAVRVLASQTSGQLPDTAFHMDWRVIAFTILLTTASGILFGVLPALRLSRPELVPALRVEGTGSTPASQQRWYRNALVVGQIALSVILLVGASLIMRSFVRLLRDNAGFDSSRVVTFNISLPTIKYSKPQQQTAFFDELLRKVDAVPGVDAAAISSTVPLVTKRMTPVLPEGQAEAPLQERPIITVEMTSPHWFATLYVPMLSGRDFSDADRADSPKVIIVNQSFARRFWPNGNPIGKHVALGRQTPSEVVGVSADVKNNGLAAAAQPEIFIPYAQLPWSNMNLLVRAKQGLDPSSLTRSLRQQVISIDPEQSMSVAQSGEELMNRSRGQARFITFLFASFAFAALVLSAVGIYGLLAYSVAQRQRELAIRMALGAGRVRVSQLVVGQGLTVAFTGVVIGLGGAALGTRLLGSLLFEIAPRDLVSFVLAPLLFLFISAIATYMQARRASRVSPLEAMR